jgi:hypothetical protein
MTNRTFAIVVVIVLALLAGIVALHRPRGGQSSRSFAPHGQP